MSENKDNEGAFRVDIIVWQREDWIQITDFFEMMKAKDPDNRAITDALEQAHLSQAGPVLSGKPGPLRGFRQGWPAAFFLPPHRPYQSGAGRPAP